MSIVLKVIFAILAIICLCFTTYVCAFYHMFESNRDAMDNYSLTAAIIFAVLFIVFFRLAVM